MKEAAETRSELMEKNRLEGLTDGIFGFAMTLLVASMILPRDAVATGSSSAALLSLLPEFYHYIIGFFVLAAFWMGHHEQLRKIHHIDQNFILLNIISLFFVTLVPFSTSFIGDYDSDVLATSLFMFNLMVLGLLFSFQWYYAARNHRLIPTDLPEYYIRKRMAHGLLVPVISFVGIIICVMGFKDSTMIYLASPLVEYVVNHSILAKIPGSED